ncbi:MAG: hypothetical protein U0637_06580 [Phycisphaerales bacterium]
MGPATSTKLKVQVRAKRPAWANRFAAPTLAALVQSLKPSSSAPFRHARQCLLAVPGMNERVAWQGVWHWTLVYTHPTLPTQAWAFLVPDPSRPLLAIPVAESALTALPRKHLTRPVRDGLVAAPVVGGLRWATWELSSKSLAENILAIAAARAALSDDAAGTAARRAS